MRLPCLLFQREGTATHVSSSLTGLPDKGHSAQGAQLTLSGSAVRGIARLAPLLVLKQMNSICTWTSHNKEFPTTFLCCRKGHLLERLVINHHRRDGVWRWLGRHAYEIPTTLTSFPDPGPLACDVQWTENSPCPAQLSFETDHSSLIAAWVLLFNSHWDHCKDILTNPLWWVSPALTFQKESSVVFLTLRLDVPPAPNPAVTGHSLQPGGRPVGACTSAYRSGLLFLNHFLAPSHSLPSPWPQHTGTHFLSFQACFLTPILSCFFVSILFSWPRSSLLLVQPANSSFKILSQNLSPILLDPV